MLCSAVLADAALITDALAALLNIRALARELHSAIALTVLLHNTR
jgi:hypothetical protein